MNQETRPPEDPDSPTAEDGPAPETPSPQEEPESVPPVSDEATGESPVAQDPGPEIVERIVEVRSGGRFVAFLALLIALAAIAGSAYQLWFQERLTVAADETRADLAGDIGRMDRGMSSLEERLTGLDRQGTQWDQRASRVERDLDAFGQRLASLEAVTESLVREPATASQPRWQEEEVELLLRVAYHQLSLARNPDSALSALEAADEAVAALDDPAYLAVRQQIADDILALRTMDRPDVEGLALRLGSLAARVDSLRLSGALGEEQATRVSADEADSGFARIRRKIGEFFASIFRIRQTAGSTAPLLAPDEAFFLKRNLELELQAARLALLMGDTGVYRESLRSARRWTEEYFDRDDPGVRGFVTAVAELEARDVEFAVPDISGSLRAFRTASGTADPGQ